MVVIIEDVTDQENQREQNEAAKDVVDECSNPQGAQDASQEGNDSGSWVEVNNESSENRENHLEDDQHGANEEIVDPEVFAVRKREKFV
jgi:hypothetical protein